MDRQLLSDKEIKSELTRMLQTVHQYLSENDIKYSIFAGTMLGAVRHKGFIPWDDDIDICLTRSEYEKLLTALKKDNFHIENLSAEGFELGNADFPFLKFKNKAISTEEYSYGGNCSIDYLWLDVFPLDYVPDAKSKLYFEVFNKLYKKMYSLKRVDKEHWKYDTKHVFYTFFINTIVKRKTLKSVTQKVIDYCKKYSSVEKEYICNVVWGIGPRGIFHKELMNDLSDYSFEDITVKGVTNYDEWLTGIYGNYMQLPPEEQRKGHELKAWYV